MALFQDNNYSSQFTNSEKEANMPLIRKILEFSVISRRSGFLALEDELKNVQNPILKTVIQLLTDAADPKLIENILREQIDKDKPKGAELLGRLLIIQGALLLSAGVPTQDVAIKLASMLGEEYAARINELVRTEELAYAERIAQESGNEPFDSELTDKIGKLLADKYPGTDWHSLYDDTDKIRSMVEEADLTNMLPKVSPAREDDFYTSILMAAAMSIPYK